MFKRHRVIFVLAVFVSLVFGSHHFFISKILKSEGRLYHPITLTSNFDASVYGARANAVYHGQLIAGDVNVSENKGSPTVLPVLNPLIMGGLGWLLGSLKRAFIFSDFLFPPLIFIALYFLAFELTGRKFAATIFAVFFVFMPKLFLFIPPITPFLFHELVKNILPDSTNVLYFQHFEYPKITYLFYTLAFYFTLRALKRDGIFATWFAGISFGMLFYTYLYDWAYFFFGLLLLSLMLIISKRYKESLRVWQIVGIGFLFSLPYWFNFLLLHQSPHYADVTSRIGVEVGDQFRFVTVWKSYLRNIFLMLFLYFVLRKNERLVLLYLIALLLPYFLVVNLQMILGFNPHPDHWYRELFLPIGLSVMMILYAVSKRFISQKLFGYGFVAGCFLITFVFGRSFYSQYLLSRAHAQNYIVSETYESGYQWLLAYTPKDSVIGSISPTTNKELLLFTHSKPFLIDGFHTTVSDDEIWNRLMRMSVVFGITPPQFSSLLKDSGILFYSFHNEFLERSFESSFTNNAQRRLPRELHDKKLGEYEKMTTDALGTISFNVDYIFFGPREQSVGQDPVKSISNLEKVFEREDVTIYKVLKAL